MDQQGRRRLTPPPTNDEFQNRTSDAGKPEAGAAASRHAMRRLAADANRLSRTDRFLVLDCRGRGCRRRLGQASTRPRQGATTPDGTIEPDFSTDGPVLTLFGPFDTTAGGTSGEYRLRGTMESVSAPSQSLTLRGRRLRADGTVDPTEVPLGPGQRIVIACGCGHRNQVSLSALSQAVERARAAVDHT